MSRPREGRLSQKRTAAAAVRHRRALELRIAGASFQQIADELGYADPKGAFKAVEAELMRTVQEPADKVRAMEVERLNRIHLKLWKRVSEHPDDDAAIDRLIRLWERRARLLGLDMPVKVAHTDTEGRDVYASLSDGELLEAIEKVLSGKEDVVKALMSQAHQAAGIE